MRISLCMIVKNEEQFIGDCLHRVLPLVDEAIIVDTGSTDNTLKILDSFGARLTVRHFKWCDDFAAARNESLRDAVGDWIIALDADEILNCNKEKLHNFLANADRDSYIITFYNHFQDSKNISKECIRIFRNVDARYEGALHEQLTGVKNIGYIDEKYAIINHYGYLPAVIKQKNKLERNLQILQSMLKEQPSNPMLRCNLGMEYARAEKYEEAINVLKNVLPDLKGQKLLIHGACQKIVRCLSILDPHYEFNQFIEDLIKNKEFSYPFFFFCLADCYQSLGLYDKALLAFSKCLERNRSNFSTSDVVGFDSFYPKIKMAQIYAKNNEITKAMSWYIEAVFDKKNVNHIGKVEAHDYLKKNAPEKVLQEFEKCLKSLVI